MSRSRKPINQEERKKSRAKDTEQRLIVDWEYIQEANQLRRKEEKASAEDTEQRLIVDWEYIREANQLRRK